MDKKQVEIKKEKLETQSPGFFQAQGLSLFPEFDRMINRFLGNRTQALMTDWPTIPRHAMGEVTETDAAYVLVAEVPGIPRDAIKVSLDGNMLSIRAEHSEEKGKEDSPRGYRRQYRNFRQSFTLPSNVDTHQIRASHEDGVLEVYLPKMTDIESKPIAVEANHSSDSGKKQTNKKH